MKISLSWLVLPALLMGILHATPTEDEPRKKDPPIIGRWDLTVKSADETYPSWLEVRRSGYETLVGSFVGRFGSARPISRVQFKDGRLQFSVPPQWERPQNDLTFDGKLDGDQLAGEMTNENGHRLAWTGKRAPSFELEQEPHY